MVRFLGKLTIYLEEKEIKRLQSKKDSRGLEDLLKHEYGEALLALQLARESQKEKKDWINPYILVERDRSLGGRAHEILVNKE